MKMQIKILFSPFILTSSIYVEMPSAPLIHDHITLTEYYQELDLQTNNTYDFCFPGSGVHVWPSLFSA